LIQINAEGCDVVNQYTTMPYGDTGPSEAQPYRIAVVDDDQAVCDSFRFLLEVMGYSAETFLSPHAFLAADHQGIARLILDHHMPQMTGLELAEKLLANDLSLPILLITGSPSPYIVARAGALGIRVLEKPPSEEDLLDFINQAD
jgi:FixJ family two-component response regulator